MKIPTYSQVFKTNFYVPIENINSSSALQKMNKVTSCCICLIESNTECYHSETIRTVLTPFRIGSSTTPHQFLHQEFSPQTNFSGTSSSSSSDHYSQPIPIASLPIAIQPKAYQLFCNTDFNSGALSSELSMWTVFLTSRMKRFLGGLARLFG